MSRESVLKTKSFAFALHIIGLYRTLKKNYREFELANQLIRSGTSVGAIIREAEHAESRKDFLHKLTIGLKEINECIYWLDLLRDAEFIDQQVFESIHMEALEILRMLIASIKTTKMKDR